MAVMHRFYLNRLVRPRPCRLRRDRFAADRGADKLTVSHGHRKRDQAGATYLISLFDNDRPRAVAGRREVMEHSRERGGGRSGRRVLIDPQARREHAGVKGRAGFDGLAAEDAGGTALVSRERRFPVFEPTVLLNRIDGGGARDLVVEGGIGPISCVTASIDLDRGRARFELARLPEELGGAADREIAWTRSA